MKVIGRIVGDPYLHVLAIGLLVARLAMGLESDTSQVSEQVKPPPQCVRCMVVHGWGNPCPSPETPSVARTVEPARR